MLACAVWLLRNVAVEEADVVVKVLVVDAREVIDAVGVLVDSCEVIDPAVVLVERVSY